MYSLGMNKATNLRIINLLIKETGTFNQQFQRPYHTVMDNGVLKSITERVMNSPGTQFNSSSLGGLAGHFIQPTAQHGSEIIIPNGWSEKRFRFNMEVLCDFQVSGSITLYIQGYTNFMGISSTTQAIAPDMEFFINSIITTKKHYQNTPQGTQVIEQVVSNEHVMCDGTHGTVFNAGQNHLVRPQDIFYGMQSDHLPGAYDSGHQSQIFDSRTILKEEATKSRRRNGLPSAYAASIIDGYQTAQQLTEFGQSELTILGNSSSHVMEEQASVDPFLNAMSQIKGDVVNNRFTFSNLRKLDPSVDHVSTTIFAGQTHSTELHTQGQTSYWQGTDNLTLAATTLSQAVPAVMMDLMISRVHFRSTNHDIGGRMNTVIIFGQGLTNIPMERFYQMFIRRLEDEIITSITYGNSTSYMIDMNIDLFDETRIKISIGNSYQMEYATPSFCDNLLAPVITNDMNVVQELVGDFSTLVNHVKEATYNTQSSFQIATSV